MWADIDYMENYEIFTVSPSYSNLSTHIKDLKSKGMTFVPILDPSVVAHPAKSGYKALDLGLEMDVFIKTYDKTKPLTGGIFGGDAYYPDFTNPNTTTWWHTMLDYLYNDLGIQFDGIWIDMNEATSFCNGYCV